MSSSAVSYGRPPRPCYRPSLRWAEWWFPPSSSSPFSADGEGLRGWAIPMATDIAFSIGCLALLGPRVPHSLKVFLTALAIFDDIGGILVIALFYGTGIQPSGLLWTVVATAAAFGLNRLRVQGLFPYLLVGGALWWAFHEAGLHPTLAGVVLGLLIPAETLATRRRT